MPGGNTRHSVALAPYPIYARSGSGCRITDVEGEERVDFLNNYTSLILGHAHPQVTEAVQRRAALGTAFTMPTPEEVELAELLTGRVAYAEQIRFCNSGSEAVMLAIKAARAFTGRPQDREVRRRVSRNVRLRGSQRRSYARRLGRSRCASVYHRARHAPERGARRGCVAVEPAGGLPQANRAEQERTGRRAGRSDAARNRDDCAAPGISCMAARRDRASRNSF